MRYARLPEQFTRLGFDDQGREYIQCTRTGDVLVQTGPDEWGHFASAEEWPGKTAALLFPELVHLRRMLRQVGEHEEIEDQIRDLREALGMLHELESNLRERIVQLEGELAGGRPA